MARLHWVPELDTGIEEIDTQHKRIVDYINRLYDIRETPNRDSIRDVIEEMVDYTISHFAFEEGMMENAGYTFAAPHKRVHELFARRVGEIKKRFDNGDNVVEELHGMLSRWLFNHIRNEDHGYINAVKLYQRVTGEGSEPTKRKGFFARLFGG
jgi:hemerythrin